ncbi:NUDIX domain-containing protein [Algiphilus sp.]|uniref:NUDIX domain-containing protein n=1 Tax=Algiphilus sp. TaxID=1872431 RepID=UPI003C329134
MSVRFHYCPRCAQPLEDGERGEVMRRVCPDTSCGFVHWDNPTPVVAAIVEHEGEIILAHNRSWPPKWYGLITGFLEASETPEDGVAREVAEELALTAEAVCFVGHYDFPQMNQLIIAYHVLATGEIRLNEELDDYKRLPPERVRPWPGGTGRAVADWLARAHGIVHESMR